MNKVTSTVTYGNKITELDDWQKRSNPWTVQLRYQGRSMTVNFWTGELAVEPDTVSVLECLLSDAHLAHDGFEEFCGNCGYDTDSRKAETIYKQVLKQTNHLKRLLGEDFNAFMYDRQHELQKYCA